MAITFKAQIVSLNELDIENFEFMLKQTNNKKMFR